MKIFYICKIDLSRMNSETVHLVEVAENLRKLGQEVIVFAPAIGRFYRSTSIKIKYVPTVIFLKVFQTFFYQFSLFFYLIYYIFKLRPDIIYCRMGPFTIITVLIAKIFKKPYFAEVNGFFPEDLVIYNKASYLTLFISSLIERFNYLFADKITVVTSEIKYLLCKKYNLEINKVIIIPNGANIDIFKSMDTLMCRESLKLEKNQYYVGFIGNFAPWQGIEYLIRAIPKVLEKINNIKFFIVGSGIQEKNLIQIVNELSLNNVIIFPGSVSYEKISLHINAFDICVAPFISISKRKNPGSPLKLYEYLACGKAVVVSDAGSVGELVRENNCGLAVTPEDSDALAEAILRLIKDKNLRDQMGKNGRRIVEEKYSWRNVAQKTLEVCRSIVR
ncbi:glycosyltransferase family 4 protein [bacterium]|nr:glycosyltransferase family 4 protein [bacterium]